MACFPARGSDENADTRGVYERLDKLQKKLEVLHGELYAADSAGISFEGWMREKRRCDRRPQATWIHAATRSIRRRHWNDVEKVHHYLAFLAGDAESGAYMRSFDRTWYSA